MSENDTENGAADKAAPDDQNADAIWERELKKRQNPEADVDDIDDGAAPNDADTGTDDEAKADLPEPVESKSGEGKATEKAQKPETVSVDRLKGTIAGQNRKIAELQREIASYSKRAKDEGKDDITDLEGLRAEYPEVVGPLIDRLSRLEANLGDQRQQLSKMSELAAVQHTETLSREESIVDQTHPGWDRLLASKRKDFDAWVQNPDNPRWIYDTFKANEQRVTDGEATARLFTAFKEHIGVETRPEPASGPIVKRSPSRRLDGARATTSRGTQVSNENDNGLTPEQIWEREAAKRAKMRQQAG